MERIKSLMIVCILLACVAPAMAADWYEIPSSGNYGTDTFTGFNYNPNPDPGVVADWYTNTYVVPYSSFVPTPYYEVEGAGPLTFNDPTAEVRFNMITARFNISADMTVGTMYMGDTYWPLNYGAYNNSTYSFQQTRQEGGNVTATTWNFGRPDEFPDASMHTSSYWNIRAGSLNIGTLNVLNDNTDALYPAGVMTNSTITTTIGGNSQVINIGDINLNQSVLYMYLSMGNTTISGDISEGNMAVLLHGNSNLGGERLYGGVLNLQMTELMQLINAGQLWVKEGSSQYQRVNYDGFAATAKTLVTSANMFDVLDVVDLGGGMVSIALIPEPATLALLGLGALAALRRKH